MEIFLGLAIAAVSLVALNFGLQRLARPDKGSERIAGCCGMALPEELLRTEGQKGQPAALAARNRKPKTKVNVPSEGPGEDSREEYHEL